MVLIGIVSIWLGLVVIAVIVDVMTTYFGERPVKEPKRKTAVKIASLGEKEVKRGIAAYRNLKKIELGLTRVNEREVRVDRPRGAHRRLQVS